MKSITDKPSHTPGPWAFSNGIGRPIGPDGMLLTGKLCQAKWWIPKGKRPKTADECEANARLIAAAPALLAALKGVVRVADRQTDEFDAARAAIANAERRP